MDDTPNQPRGWSQTSLVPQRDVVAKLEIHWLGAHAKLGAVRLEVRDSATEQLLASQATANLVAERVEQTAALLLTDFLREHSLLLAQIEPF